MSETPKWRCGMTLCNACGLLAAKRSKSDAKGFVEDADAESQDTAAMQAARTAACASALAALSAARAIAPPRAAFGASSEPKTVRPPIKPAVQRAVQSEPLCARGVAQPAAMPSTNSVGTLALASNSPSGSLVEERGSFAALPPVHLPPSKNATSVSRLSTASETMLASNLPPSPSLPTPLLASPLSDPAAGQDYAPTTLLSIQQQLTDGSDQDATTPSASPLVTASKASSPARVDVSGPTTISAVTDPLTSPLCAPGAVTFARPSASAMGAPMEAGLAVQAAAASVAKAASIVRSVSSVHAKSLAAGRKLQGMPKKKGNTKATAAFPEQASMRMQPMQPAAQHAIPMAHAMLMEQPMPISHSIQGQQKKLGGQIETPPQLLQMTQPVQQQMMQTVQQMHLMHSR